MVSLWWLVIGQIVVWITVVAAMIGGYILFQRIGPLLATMRELLFLIKEWSKLGHDTHVDAKRLLTKAEKTIDTPSHEILKAVQTVPDKVVDAIKSSESHSGGIM